MPKADSARIRRATRTILLPLLACALGGVAALAQENHPSLAEQFVGWFTSDPAPVFTHPGVISLLSNLPFPREDSEDSVEITEDRLRLAPKVTERGSAVGDLRDLFAPRAEAITPSLPQKANAAVPPAPDPPSAVETPSRSDRADVVTGSVPSPASRAGNDRREADANNQQRSRGVVSTPWPNSER
jgi:hypothetical protein